MAKVKDPVIKRERNRNKREKVLRIGTESNVKREASKAIKAGKRNKFTLQWSIRSKQMVKYQSMLRM